MTTHELDAKIESSQSSETGISKDLIFVMAVAAGGTVANNYYNQPLLGDIAQTYGVSASAVGLVAAATQIGYSLGLLFLAPLGDRFNRKRIILFQSAGLVLALLAAAASPTLAWLVAASLAVGLMTTIVQQLIPFAAHLAGDANRGRIVGTVMTGLTIGILLARTLSGFVGQHLGWQAMFAIAAGIAALIGLLLAWQLPNSHSTSELSYGRLLGSLWSLVRSQPVLREAAVVGALWFACFNVFWATLALHVEQPPFHLTSEGAGLFGLIGVVGATTARVSGQLADRIGPRRIIGLALLAILAAFAIMALWGDTFPGLIAGIILLDAGVFGAQIPNQTRVFALVPEARSRINSVYMVCYYGGGALGSASGSWAWAAAGWHGVCFLAVGLLTLALSIHIWCGRQTGSEASLTDEVPSHSVGVSR